MDIRTNRFLADFSPAGRDRLVRAAVVHNFIDGEFLFHEGDPAHGVCLVLEGTVEIVRVAGGLDKVMREFGPDDFLGEVAVLDGFGRSTSARARGEVRIALVPRGPLLETLETEPVGLTLHLFQQVLSHLRQANDRYVDAIVHKEKLGLVGEMAASLMHDLRNPVTGIRLAADLLDMTHGDADTARTCDMIRLQCDRLVAMATELLEFSRGETRLKPGLTDTTAFLEQFRQLNAPLFEHPNIAVILEPEPASIVIDTMRGIRVLQNLVGNAVDALGEQPDGQVRLRCWVEGGELFLEVGDNGPGIPVHIRERLFEPFVTHGKSGGTGLGMAIVHNIVTAHGGTIRFFTQDGAGTTFLVTLPQPSSDEPEEMPLAEAA